MSEAEAKVTPLTEVLAETPGMESLREKYLGEERAGEQEPQPARSTTGLPFEEPLGETTSADTSLHGAKPANIEIKHEKPEHRLLIFMYGQGMTNKEVFLELGGQWDELAGKPVQGTGRFTYPYLTQIRRQSWFQERLVNYIESLGRSRMEATFEAEIPASLEAIKEVRDDRGAPANARLNAATFFFDRLMGKPTQHVKSEKTLTVKDFETDARKLNDEIQTLEAEIIHLNPAERKAAEG